MTSGTITDTFSDNQDRLSKNANYIIIINGFLLTAFIAILLGNWSDPGVSHNYTVAHNLSSDIYTITGIPSSTGMEFVLQIMVTLLSIVVIGPIIYSLLFCLGTVHAGVWERVKEGEISREKLIQREEAAFDNYEKAAKALLYGIVGLYAFSFSPITGKDSPITGAITALLIYVVSAAILSVVIKRYKVFGRFRDGDGPTRRVPSARLCFCGHFSIVIFTILAIIFAGLAIEMGSYSPYAGMVAAFGGVLAIFATFVMDHGVAECIGGQK